MEKQPLVTVVLPIYNVENYLNRCMESIVNQTYRNLEIIMVDDGSPDNCPEMCDEWARKDSRIKVIHKKNQGQGIARNDAIGIATGDYICFIDSDDYVSLDVIEKSCVLAEKELADIVVFGLNTVSTSGRVVNSFVPWAETETYESSDVINVFLPEYLAPNPYKKEPKKFYMSSCVSLYSMKMIRNSGWRFVSEREIISEDVYSLLKLFPYVNKVAVLPQALYYYCENKESFSRSYNADRYKRIKHFYLESVKLCRDLGYSEVIVQRVSKIYVAYTIATLKQEYMLQRPAKAKKAATKSIIDDDVLQKVLRKNKKDVASITKKALYFAIRNKMYRLCYLLLTMKSKFVLAERK